MSLTFAHGTTEHLNSSLELPTIPVTLVGFLNILVRSKGEKDIRLGKGAGPSPFPSLMSLSTS